MQRPHTPARRDARAPALALVLAVAWIAMGALPARAARPSASTAGQRHTVIIEGLRYKPELLVVHRGDRITWINKDLVPHTVTSTERKFDSHQIAPNGSWTYSARRAGVYDYVCTLHGTMKGRLEVR